MPSNAPIGLYDSGLGGLSVVREVLRQLPHESHTYIGDTARVPYGGRSPEELLAFNREILDLLLQSGVKAVVVACNTSSAVALPVLDAECPVPIIGLIEAGARAAVEGGQRIGVIATEATIRSRAHVRAIEDLDVACQVFPTACPQLVPMIESGLWEGPKAEAIVFESLAPLLDAKLDTLILGCTHYPFVRQVISDILGPSVRLVDPAEEAVRVLGDILAAHDLLADQAIPRHRMLVSGDPITFYQQAHLLLGDVVPAVEHVPVANALPIAL